MTAMVKKVCKACGVEKSLCFFHRSHRHAMGVKPRCANCCNKIARAKYRASKRPAARLA